MGSRLLLLTLTLTSAAAFAQEGEADAGTAAVAAPVYRAVKLNPEVDKPEVLLISRYFFSALLLGDLRQIAEQSAWPFQLEDRRLANEDEVMQAFSRALRQKRTDLLTLYGIEVLTPAEMEAKYGKAPARLKDFPSKRPGVYLAVANLSGHAAVAAVQKQANGDWAVVGYHD